MKKVKRWQLVLWPFLLFILLSMVYNLDVRGRPAPVPMKKELFPGVMYYRRVSFYPHFMIAHLLVIDTRTKGMQLLVTPADNAAGAPLNARTTSQFMSEFGVQIAINGDGFSPWWSRSPMDYYPHTGDPVTPNGYAASRGRTYSWDQEIDDGINPTIYISKRNYASMGNRPGNVFNAVSGDRMLVVNGEPESGLDATGLNPRTAIGINRNGRYLIIAVVDGRQPLYSTGATFEQLARLMIEFGARYAMNLDGGGSSTMVIEGEDGKPIVLNSPIDNYIPGRERPVANHLGIFLKK